MPFAGRPAGDATVRQIKIGLSASSANSAINAFDSEPDGGVRVPRLLRHKSDLLHGALGQHQAASVLTPEIERVAFNGPRGGSLERC
jgi:hypothetical protein